MSVRYTLIALVVLAIACIAQSASAETRLPGETCGTLGATTMSDNHDTLIACMLVTAAPGITNCTSGVECRWRAMATVLPVCDESTQALQSDGVYAKCETIGPKNCPDTMLIHPGSGGSFNTGPQYHGTIVAVGGSGCGADTLIQCINGAYVNFVYGMTVSGCVAPG